MPQKVLAVPDWLDPAKRSVFDSQLTQALQRVADFLGVADPQQVMAIGGALEGPGAELGGIAGAVAKRFPRLANAIKAYHGGPHDFEAFDSSKIGTGEGAQAYGHGLYFAEQEATADVYRSALATPEVKVGGEAKRVPSWAANLPPEDRLVRRIADKRALRPRASDAEILADVRAGLEGELKTGFGRWPSDAELAHLRQQQQLLEDYTAKGVASRHGRMYEVNIHADPQQFLDWDTPIREQPRVVEYLRQRGYQEAPWPYTGKLMHPSGGTFIDLETTGEDAYRGLINLIRDTGSRAPGARLDARASQELASGGIPGIKYLDAGSRTAGEGSRNFVVFDDKTIELLRKYGILAPVAGATIPAVTKPGALAPEAP